MNLELTKSGDSTARFNNRFLHSSYDPVREAEKFLNNWMNTFDNSSKKVIILVEPGLGYLINILNIKYPDIPVISVFTNTETYHYCVQKYSLEGYYLIFNDAHFNLIALLDRINPDIHIRDIGIMIWPASEVIFENECREIEKKIFDSIKILQGNEQTSKHFSRRWFINGVRNFLRYDFSGSLHLSDSPVILVSSGPSLERCIMSIKERKNHYIIAALPSSLAILESHGIMPDILFSTDPGYYAREHFKYLQKETICISPITSSLVPFQSSLSGFTQNGFIERLLYEKMELPFVPEMGTVAATALFYLRKLTKGPIYVAGLDFCMEDLKIHAQPHSFNPLILKSESRQLPGISLFYNRVQEMTDRQEHIFRFSKSMDTYAAWFRSQQFDEEIYRLNPSVVDLPMSSVSNLPDTQLSEKTIQMVKSEFYPSYIKRRNRVEKILNLLQEDISNYNLYNKISPFLKRIADEVNPVFLSRVHPVARTEYSEREMKNMNQLVELIGHIL